MKKISTQKDTLSENLRERVLESQVRPLDACDEPKDPQCPGSGYAHKPHGDCIGYTYDRT